MGIRVSLVSLLAIGLLLANCANQKFDQQQKVAQWGRWEYTFTAEEPVDQEIDLQLTVELTSPSGKTDQVPGFWDGDSLWKARFMPDETGIWKFQTESQP